MARDPALCEVLLNRLEVILEVHRKEADAGVIHPRSVPCVRQRQEGKMLPQGEGTPIRHDALDGTAGGTRGGKGQGDVNLAIRWKRFGHWCVDA
jgi:hypothetical protein